MAELFAVEIKQFYFTREAIRKWAAKFASLITETLKSERPGQNTTRWKIDETLIKVNKKYHYLYRAIDSYGKLVETKLSEVYTLESTSAFLEPAIQNSGHKPSQITTDKAVTYSGAIEKVVGQKVEHRTSRYLNNRMEQDHRGIKTRYKVMKSFKNPMSAERFC